jgi:two-component system phosphate regulon response regulator PhoB
MSSQILIVEDDEAIREMMAFSLTQADFQVIKADSGFMALQQLQQQRPDLVVIDWGLPDFSGLELLSIIRRDEVLRELPLIMLTARAEERDKIKGLEYGADDYLIKPVSVQELIARIKAHLRRARGF